MWVHGPLSQAFIEEKTGMDTPAQCHLRYLSLCPQSGGISSTRSIAKLAGVTDKEQRKKYLKTREKELKKEFADPLSNLSIYQGKVLDEAHQPANR